jgi:hypothetical protein
MPHSQGKEKDAKFLSWNTNPHADISTFFINQTEINFPSVNRKSITLHQRKGFCISITHQTQTYKYFCIFEIFIPISNSVYMKYFHAFDYNQS